MKTYSPTAAFMVAGLSEREARIWHTLAKDGPLNVSQIAEATKLHRPAVYEFLPSLLHKKLIKEVKGNRRVTYRTTGPRALEAWRASHDAAFAAELKRLKKDDIQADVSDDVRVYHGKDMRRVWEDVLASTPRASLFFRYDGYKPGVTVKEYMPAHYYENIERKRIDRFVITNGALRKAYYKKRLECASHMLPESFDPFEQGISQFVFGDKIALIDFTTETAFVIKNKALASYHARLFQFLYKNLPV